ncbi:MAG: hypothetical protein NZM44_00280 [Candidatus Calescibacterium sp.]|nr:hypothetical protein [Candidatus Calescibacterium sp.]
MTFSFSSLSKTIGKIASALGFIKKNKRCRKSKKSSLVVTTTTGQETKTSGDTKEEVKNVKKGKKSGVGKFLTVIAKLFSIAIVFVYFGIKFWFVIEKSEVPVGWFSVDEALGLLYAIIVLQLIVLPIDISIILKNFWFYKHNGTSGGS